MISYQLSVKTVKRKLAGINEKLKTDNFELKTSLYGETAPLYYRSVWKPSDIDFEAIKAASRERSDCGLSGNVLIFDIDHDVRMALEEKLKREGCPVQVILVRSGKSFQELGDQTYEINPGHKQDYLQLRECLAGQGVFPETILHLWAKSDPGDISLSQKALKTKLDYSLYSVLYLSQVLMEKKPKDKIRLLYAYQSQKGHPQPHHAAISGLAKTLCLENPKLICKIVQMQAAPEQTAPEQTAPEQASPEQALSTRRVKYAASIVGAGPCACPVPVCGRPQGAAPTNWSELVAYLPRCVLRSSESNDQTTEKHSHTKAQRHKEKKKCSLPLCAFVPLCDSIISESKISESKMIDIMVAELMAEDKAEVEVRYEQGHRFVRHWQELELDRKISPDQVPALLKGDGVYVITGGLGGLGFIFARYLARQVRAKLVLAGRSDLSARGQERIRELESLGSEAIYIKADIAQKEQAQELIAKARQRFGRIHGVIHSAGILRDSLVIKKTKDELEAVLAPKVYGTVYLDEATRDERLDFFVLFSSVVAVTGNVGQADYAYANSFMDSFAEKRDVRSGGCRALAPGYRRRHVLAVTGIFRRYHAVLLERGTAYVQLFSSHPHRPAPERKRRERAV